MDWLMILQYIFSPKSMLVMSSSIMFGIIGGALPGVSSTMCVSLFLPFTFIMEPGLGILSLMAIYTASVYGGSVTAILINTPGTASSAATAIDGFKLAQQGKGDFALRISTISSGFGGVISGFALLLFAPPLSRLALLFGPSEFFLLACMGLSAVATLAEESIIKGVISALFGLFLVTVGVDYTVGMPRFTFGLISLEGGISFVPALIGLFAMSQVIKMTKPFSSVVHISNMIRGKILPSLQEYIDLGATYLRGSIIGIIVGILPGAGTEIASWIAYNTEKKMSPKRNEIGKGSKFGVAASEVANNAATGAALIPLFTLGVPGSPVAAVILGGLLIHGLLPGSELFTTHAGITYTAIIGFLLANVLMTIFGLLLIRPFAWVAQLRSSIITPMIFLLCFIGAFSTNNNFFDVWVMIIFGFIGYFMEIGGFNPAPTVLAMVLGPMAEQRFLQMHVLSDGRVLQFMLSRPLSMVLILLIIVFLVSPLFFRKVEKAF